jgi:hypothetical protein
MVCSPAWETDGSNRISERSRQWRWWPAVCSIQSTAPGQLGLRLDGTRGRGEEGELREMLTAGGDGRRRPETSDRRSSGGRLGFWCGRRSSGPPVRGRGASASARHGRARGGVSLLWEMANQQTAGGGSVLQRAARCSSGRLCTGAMQGGRAGFGTRAAAVAFRAREGARDPPFIGV